MPLDHGLRVIRREPLADGPAAGRTVVLVHGAMDRATSFTRLMAKLRDWTVVAYDRRGYGHSMPVGPSDLFRHQVDDLLAVLDGERAVAFGHSLGGDVVLAAATGQPGTLTSALVWEPPQPWLPWWPDQHGRGGDPGMAPEDRAEQFMRRMVGDRLWERLPRATRDQRRAEGLTLEAELRALDTGPVFDAERVRIPVTVGRGGMSPAYQRRSVRELARQLPQGETAEIAEAGHGAHLTHPGEVAALIRRVAAREGPGLVSDPDPRLSRPHRSR